MNCSVAMNIANRTSLPIPLLLRYSVVLSHGTLRGEVVDPCSFWWYSSLGCNMCWPLLLASAVVLDAVQGGLNSLARCC